MRFESGTLETLQRMVASRGSMTLVPYLATLHLSEERAHRPLRPFAEPVPSRQVRLLFGKAYLKRRLIEMFTGVVMDALPQGIEPLTAASNADR